MTKIKRALTNVTFFSVIYFVVLGIDIFIKTSAEPLPYRYFTKSVLILLLGLFYFYNKNKRTPKYKNKIVIICLSVFLLGDLILLNSEVQIFYIIGLVLFIVGKILYTARFSNQNDFELRRLIPFMLACSIYIIFIMLLVYDNLGSFFIPAVLYLFSCMLVALFAFLRKGVVDNYSYRLVLLGILCAILSDTFGVLQSFYDENLPYHNLTIMFFYAASQFCIVVGLAKEKIISNSYFFIR